MQRPDEVVPSPFPAPGRVLDSAAEEVEATRKDYERD